jgi:hypothetical protein
MDAPNEGAQNRVGEFCAPSQIPDEFAEIANAWPLNSDDAPMCRAGTPEPLEIPTAEILLLTHPTAFQYLTRVA